MVDCLKIHIIHLSVIDPVKLTTMQTHHNPINIFKKNPNIILHCVFSSNSFEHPKHHRHQ